jgi:hypothetical protein
MMNFRRWIVVLAVCAMMPAAAAADEPFAVREWGVRVAGGVDPSNIIQYYAVHPFVGFSLWQKADRWLTERDVAGRWVIEPWAAYVRDDHGKHQTSSFEIGVSPLFARLTFGGSAVRPFIEGGEGILYTDLRKQRLGTRMQFSSQFGAGLEFALDDDRSLTIAARVRHMSNAGIASSNPGITTLFGLIGITFR